MDFLALEGQSAEFLPSFSSCDLTFATHLGLWFNCVRPVCCIFENGSIWQNIWSPWTVLSLPLFDPSQGEALPSGHMTTDSVLFSSTLYYTDLSHPASADKFFKEDEMFTFHQASSLLSLLGAVLHAIPVRQLFPFPTPPFALRL